MSQAIWSQTSEKKGILIFLSILYSIERCLEIVDHIVPTLKTLSHQEVKNTIILDTLESEHDPRRGHTLDLVPDLVVEEAIQDRTLDLTPDLAPTLDLDPDRVPVPPTRPIPLPPHPLRDSGHGSFQRIHC